MGVQRATVRTTRNCDHLSMTSIAPANNTPCIPVSATDVLERQVKLVKRVVTGVPFAVGSAKHDEVGGVFVIPLQSFGGLNHAVVQPFFDAIRSELEDVLKKNASNASLFSP